MCYKKVIDGRVFSIKDQKYVKFIKGIAYVMTAILERQSAT